MKEATLNQLSKEGWLEFGDGYRTKRSELADEGVPILRVAEVKNGHLEPTLLERISTEHESRFATKSSQVDDVVLTTKGTVGRVARITADTPRLVYSPQLCWFRCVPHGDLLPRYLYYWLQSPEFRRQATAVQGQTDMADYINLRDLGHLRLSLPDLDQQQRVVAVLASLDDKIDVNQRIASSSENLAVAELSARLDQAEWSPLGEVASHHKAAVDPSELGDQEVDHFSIPAFDSGRRPVREPASCIKSGKLRVEHGDILVSRLNPRIPRIWSARTSPEVPAMCSTEFLVLRPTGAAVTAGLIFAAATQPGTASDMTQRATGTSGSHQRIKPADAMAVPVPVVKDESLSTLLDELVDLAGHSRQEAATLAELRDALLPKLLSGELRVREAEEVVEGVA